MQVTDYLTLGRSGLRVSPLCLGAMTFGGPAEAWTCDETTSRALIREYLEVGGNFIDTADIYREGESERIVGQTLAAAGLREQTVVATKFTFTSGAPGINALGNGRKNIWRALDDSLRRLATDYVDLYWMHAWDTVTPLEEVVQTFDALIRAGKIRYYGLSDVPAWYAARAYDFARHNGFATPIALQLEYSLVERVIELEHLPAAASMGLGLCPWSPLGGGALSGKYRRGDSSAEGRLAHTLASGKGILSTDRVWSIIETLDQVATELNKTSAQVALNWIADEYRSTSVILGVTRSEQLRANLGALEFEIPADARQRLSLISQPAQSSFYRFFVPKRLAQTMGAVRGWDD
jgi:aryl-alcohol dehydrogenase-like predicted oxidoreductase